MNEVTKRKISRTAKLRGVGKWMLGKKASAKARENMSKAAKRNGFGLWMKGRTIPESVKLKISIATLGEKNHSWKGDKVGYVPLHLWVSRTLGKPKLCAHCLTTSAKKFEWANVSGKYQRNLSDWIRLCTSCHRRYDYGLIMLKNK